MVRKVPADVALDIIGGVPRQELFGRSSYRHDAFTFTKNRHIQVSKRSRVRQDFIVGNPY